MEALITSLVVNILLPIAFGWLWKKKVTPLRQAAEAVVTAVAKEAAVEVAAKTKELVESKPAVKAALDRVIADMNANVKN